jgi:hypothetical protein
MAVSHTFVAAREQCFQQIERLTNSHSLHGSESLCKLLHYLAGHSLAEPPSTVKEYQIATEVFGRSPHFDPHTDSTVRVQAGRLRTKLSEYYATEGVDDPYIVKLPKGSYALTFEARPLAPHRGAADSLPITVSEQIAPSGTVPAYWRGAATVLALFLIAAVVSLAALARSRRTSAPALTSPQDSSVALQAFWKPFLTGSEEPWVIFSNAAFVGRPETGLRYFSSQRDSKTDVRDHYTGVGEVLAVHALDQAFVTLGRRIRVKRGSLFSLDDAKDTDLIFVGSPSENLALLDIPGSQEFVFKRVVSGPRQGDLAVVSTHPRPGEPSSYLASPSSDPLTEDYAVVSCVPGLDPSHVVMILAGTTTFGTEGAVEFVSRSDSVERLLHRIPTTGSGDPKPFEALLRVKVARGVPVESELVAVRPR